MELIKREDALEAIRDSELGQEYDEVEKVPSVDAVEAVRCKDCINGKPLDNGDVYKCMMIGHNNPPYSYCWWGERREG